MTIEKRLKDHMSEHAQNIRIETADPGTITNQASTPLGRAVTVVAAVLVVLAAGVGFWLLSSDGGPTTEIAAGEANATEDSEANQESPADVQPNIILETVDVTAENSPGHGQVLVDDGVYYVLSTAPGRVNLEGTNLSESEYIEIYRQNSFYILDQDNRWTVTEFEDRFISDFDVNDGVLYVVSTGSVSGAGAAFGSSTDRGQSWSWTPFDDLPDVNQLALLAGAEHTVVFANRRGYPDYNEALKMAIDAGVPVTDFTLRGIDHKGFSYLPIDPEDRCAAVLAQFMPELQGFNDYLSQASEEERAMAEAEYTNMLGWIREEVEANGCELDANLESTESINVIEFPDPIYLTWDELGVTTPESWRPWSTVYTFDGERFTDVGKPFGDELEVGYTETVNGRLSIFTYDSSLVEEVVAETVWATTDGVNWEQEVRRFDEAQRFYYGPYQRLEPKAGNRTFRIWWDESAYEEYEETTATTVVTEDTIGADQTEGPAITEEAIADEAIYFEGVEPQPLLQQSIADGPWETVTLAELAPDVNVGNRILRDVRGTSLGVFLVYGEPFTEGPPQNGLTVVYSNNGTDWNSFELEGNSIEPYSGDGDVLLFSHKWATDETQQTTTKTLLVRPAG